jgi:hypothetical protein
MKCNEYQDLISDRHDGKIEPDREKALLEHLQQCRDCSNYAKAFQRVMDEMDSLEAPDLSLEQQHRIWTSLSSANARPFGHFLVRSLSFSAAAILIFLFGYLFRGWIHNPTGKSGADVREAILMGDKSCTAMFDYNYEINPKSIYQLVQRTDSDNSAVSQLPLPVPRRLNVHGPYSLRPEKIEFWKDALCLPFVSPYGQVLVLQMSRGTGSKPDRVYQVSEASDKILYHRIAWACGGWQWRIEGRVPADYLLDLAMEVDREVRRSI